MTNPYKYLLYLFVRLEILISGHAINESSASILTSLLYSSAVLASEKQVLARRCLLMTSFADFFQCNVKNGASFCKQEFPALWNEFVDAFQDQLHARGRAARPPPAKVIFRPPYNNSRVICPHHLPLHRLPMIMALALQRHNRIQPLLLPASYVIAEICT